MTAVLRIALPLVLIYTSGFTMQQAPARDTVAQRNVGTAAVSGTVVHQISGQPLRRVSVTLSNSERNLRLAAVTDETGKFAFNDLPDGRYLLTAARPAFVTVNFGATRAERPGTPIALASGEQRTGITLRMPPGAVITGTVRNRSGDPVPDARVIVLRPAPSYLTGEPSLAPVSGGIGQATDDKGEYRVFGLPAGDYYVVALASIGTLSGPELRETSPAEVEWAVKQLQSPGSGAPPEPGRAVDYVPVFYPGAFTQASAATVTVKAGEERAGIDIPLAVVPTGRIDGQVVSLSGELPAALQINVIAHDTIPGVPFSGFGTARADATGRFVSAGLAPGDYTITVRVPSNAARGGGPGAAALFGLANVSISGGDVNATVTLGSGITVTGRLIFAGAAKPPADLTRVRVNLEAARSRTPTLGVPSVMADSSGNFQIVGVTPGRYRLSATGASAWFVKEATIGGRDSLDVPVEIGDRDITGAEITFTDQQTEISGDLLDTAGKPAPEYFIIIYPAEQKYWVPQSRRIQSTRPGNDGRFRFQNLPPGDYLTAAVTDVQQNEWYDPAFLAQLVGASTKITLAEGEKKTQSLRIKGGVSTPQFP